MPTPAVKNVKRIVPKKRAEFDLFLHVIEKGQAMHLGKIAELLGVAPETLSDWKKDPRAVAAQTRGLVENLSKMQEVGAEDWRMYEKNLALAGMVAVTKTDVMSGGEKISVNILSFSDNEDNNNTV